jgi:hypothetical protein
MRRAPHDALEYPNVEPSIPHATIMNWFAASFVFFTDLELSTHKSALGHHN